MTVGDVNSDARGSGARFNTDKAMVQYIPARVIHDAYWEAQKNDSITGDAWSGLFEYEKVALKILYGLALFEEGENNDPAKLMFLLPLEYRWKATCEQFDFGARKYAPWNWAKGMKWSIPIACIKRHCIKLLEGECIDPESGVHHYGALGCNIVMLAHFVNFYDELDDRPPSSVFKRFVEASDGGQ